MKPDELKYFFSYIAV